MDEPIDAQAPVAGTAARPLRRRAHIGGDFHTRQGDGSNIRIRKGACEVHLTALDATLSWVDGDTHGLAAMPLTDFQRQLELGHISFVDDAPG